MRSVINGPWPDESRCQVSLIHRDKSEARCVLHRGHQEDDSDHVDEHLCHAPVLVHQSSIEEVRRVSEAQNLGSEA